MIEIVNMRKEKPKAPYDIQVDRASILGNPFILKGESHRDEVCDKYNEYFHIKKNDDVGFYSELKKLLNIYKYYGKIRLFCWCVPKRCHAETIKEWLEFKIKIQD